MEIKEGVKVDLVRCDCCGNEVSSRLESPDGRIGCLECFRKFLCSQDQALRSGMPENSIGIAASVALSGEPISFLLKP